jgi:hypothetical protein
MPIHNAIASVAVKDLKAAVTWYARLIRRPADFTPMPGLAESKFDGGGSLQIYQLAERAGKGSVTLAATELDQQIAELKKHGIEPGGPVRNPKVNVVMIKDPDGNSIALAEALAADLAR